MPPEPEKKIENALRAYAKQRQASSGPPLEMHPATRKLLQEEVRRQFGEGTPAEPDRAWWVLLLPRFGFAVGVATMLALAIWAFLPTKPPRPIEMAGTGSQDSGRVSLEESRFGRESKPAPASLPEPPAVAATPAKATAEAPVNLLSATATVNLPAATAGAPIALEERGREQLAAAERGPQLTTFFADSVRAVQSNEAARREIAFGADTADRLTNNVAILGRAPASEAATEARLGEAGSPESNLTLNGHLALAARPADTKLKSFALKEKAATVPLPETRADETLARPSSLPRRERAVSAARPSAPSAPAPTGVAPSDLGLSARPAEQPMLVEERPKLAPTLATRRGSTAEYARASGVATFGQPSEAPQRPTPSGPKFARENMVSPKQSQAAYADRVLNRFTLSCDGAQVRIFDADGSVYEGQFMETTSGNESKLADSKKVVSVSPAPAATGSGQFVVAGTNRTLNQLVRLEGNLVTFSPLSEPRLGVRFTAKRGSEMQQDLLLNRENQGYRQPTAPPPPTAGATSQRIEGVLRVGAAAPQPLHASELPARP